MELKPIIRKLLGSDTKAVRIPMKPGDKKERYVQFSLNSSFQFLDFLSLRLAETDAYRLFQADYGVVAGRVIGNEGLGIPNCRISLFIPRDEASDTFEERLTKGNLEAQLVNGLYPFENVTDEDSQGRRYNLLPSRSRNRGFNGFPENNLGVGATPKVPVGTFPEKDDIVANPSLLSVYGKFYRYSTVTNEAGDYMLFGVPSGTHMIHMDCDLTDIGRWSLSPLLMTQTLGYPKDLFEDNGTAIRPSTDLSVLPNIQSQNVSVEVKPLWTQSLDDETVVGITRQDFKIVGTIRPFFTVFGSNFTMAKNRWWGDNLIFRLHFGWKNLCVQFGPKKRESMCDPRPRFFFDIGIRIGYRKKFDLGIVKFKIEFGNPDGDGLTFKIDPTIDIQIPNIMPFLRFEFGDNYCRLDGGKYDNTAVDIINHGNTCQCDVEDALKEIPDSGITDALFLRNHRADKLDIKLFNLTGGTDMAAEAMNQLIYTNRDRLTPNNSSVIANFDPEVDLELLRDGSYVKLVEDGQFILQVPTNRRLVVTAEDGRLVESSDPSKGVYSEYRGWMYVSSNSEIDNPAGKDRTGRIALKIPQLFEYSKKPREWQLYHRLFTAGEMYSVAQRIATKESDFSAEREAENDLDGTFNGLKGWDNQTGIILDVDDRANPMRTVGSTNQALPGNHVTSIGAEYDYNRPNESGGSTAVNDPSQGVDNGVVQYGDSTEPEPYTDTLPDFGVNSGFVVVGIPDTSSGNGRTRDDILHRVDLQYDIAIIPLEADTWTYEIYAVDLKLKFVLDDSIPKEQIAFYRWNGSIPDAMLVDPQIDSTDGSTYVRIRIKAVLNGFPSVYGYSDIMEIALRPFIEPIPDPTYEPVLHS